MTIHSKSSKVWLHEHANDHYVHMAQKGGYRVRAAYKLLEINEKDKLVKRGTVFADLGSAPGSWSQVAAKLVGDSGKVFVLGISPMDEIEGVFFVQGDLREDDVLVRLESLSVGRPLDLVICNMAPNMSGNAVTDRARSYYLRELASDSAANHLKTGDNPLVKIFQGAEFQEYTAATCAVFSTVQTRKPEAPHNRSSEIYLLGRNKR